MRYRRFNMTEIFHIPSYRDTIVILILAFLYFFTGKLSLDLLSGHNIVNLGVFAPEGIALAFALYFGRKVWFGIFIGQFLLAYVNHIAWFPALGISAVNATEAMIAIALFYRFRLNRELKRFRDVIGLVLMIVLLLEPFSALFSTLLLLLFGHITADQLGYSLFSWWFGNVMGQLLFAPFMLLLFLYYRKLNMGIFFLYGIVFGLFLYLLEIEIAIGNPFLLLSLTIPVLVWIVSYKGRLYGMFLSVVVSVVSSYSVYVATGAFYYGDKTDNIINYNLFVLAHVATVLVAGVLFEERKKYEEKLRHIIDKEVNKNREQQLLMLQQNRLAQMGEMINMIAHQWRQPLNHLSLLNQTLYHQYKKNTLSDEKMQGFTKKSEKTIRQMSSTIDDFRNFFKPDKVKSTFCVNEIVSHILDITAPMFKHHHITVVFDEHSPYYAYGFPNELGQTVLNILYNAQDALNERKRDTKKVEIKISRRKKMVELSLCDNAGGIPSTILPHIFDPYFSTKSNKSGTGLGLYISKIIIEEHMQGRLCATNTDEGACFTLSFPETKNGEGV